MKITNVEFGGIDHRDAPDYADAFIESCDIDGIEATQKQIEAIPDDVVYELLMEYLC